MDNSKRHSGGDVHPYRKLLDGKNPAVQSPDFHLGRDFHRLLVINEIRKNGPLARIDIALRLKLSRATISNIMDGLLQEGIVHEGRFLDATPRGGRRAILVHFHADAGRVLGVDVGRTHLTIVLTNFAADILMQQTLPFDTNKGALICLDEIIAAIRAFAARADLNWEQLLGIGLGIPGPLHTDFHRLSSPPHMSGWEEVDIWQVLSDTFHVPVILDKDANMGAVGESRCGAGRGHSSIAYIKIGTGIGGGLMLNGTLYRGQSSSAGEIGHMVIDENGPRCLCRNRGCLETLAATHAIVSDASQGISLMRKRDQAEGGTTSASSACAKQDIVEVLQAARAGDAASIAALERAGERIGVAVTSLINIFNPSAIILDGGIAKEGEILLTTLRQVAATSSLPAAWNGTSLVPGELGENAIALGAALTVIDAAFALPVLAGTSDTPNSGEAKRSVPTYYRSARTASPHAFPN